MAVRVICFGRDDCYRVPVLQSAGYEVTEAESLDSLALDLQGNDRVDAVIVSEDDHRSAENAADLVRQQSTAPIILFWRHNGGIDESKFDLVCSSFVEPQVWLERTAALILRKLPVQMESERLYSEMKAAR